MENNNEENIITKDFYEEEENNTKRIYFRTVLIMPITFLFYPIAVIMAGKMISEQTIFLRNYANKQAASNNISEYYKIKSNHKDFYVIKKRILNNEIKKNISIFLISAALIAIVQFLENFKSVKLLLMGACISPTLKNIRHAINISDCEKSIKRINEFDKVDQINEELRLIR